MNYAEEKYLKIIKNTSIATNKINNEFVDIEKNTTCGVKNPKFIESINKDYDLKKLGSSSDEITTYNIINTINFCDFDDFSD